MRLANGEMVTVVRPAVVTDRYNNSTIDWSNATTFDIDGCAIAPGDQTDRGSRGRGETSGDREAGIRVDHTLYLPEGVASDQVAWPDGEAVRSTDWLRFRGDDHEVVGRVEVWRSPFTGVTRGCVVRTSRVEG